jgi:predicted metal-dependent hydrolase
MSRPITQVARLTLKTPAGSLRYTLGHRPRVTRRMHLDLDDDGNLCVIVPRRWSRQQVDRLLQDNTDWVQSFLHKARQRHLKPLRYAEGGRHLFAGEKYPLAVRLGDGVNTRVRLVQGVLRVETPERSEEGVKAALRDWYRAQAEARFYRRMEVYAARAPWLDGRTIRLHLRRMTSTWGTCRRGGVIRLNTHLIKAPPATLDYVIAHELCHLRHMHHGPSFWEQVQELYPRWREQVAQLDQFGNRYTQE